MQRTYSGNKVSKVKEKKKGHCYWCKKRKEDEARGLNGPYLVVSMSPDKELDFYLENNGKPLKVSMQKSDML